MGESLNPISSNMFPVSDNHIVGRHCDWELNCMFLVHCIFWFIIQVFSKHVKVNNEDFSTCHQMHVPR